METRVAPMQSALESKRRLRGSISLLEVYHFTRRRICPDFLFSANDHRIVRYMGAKKVTAVRISHGNLLVREESKRLW
jgi:hypothetical protein